jgi:hypothetical protein
MSLEFFASLRRAAAEDAPTLRSSALGAAILFLIVNITFFPFIWGDRTLQASAMIPSLYGAGSSPNRIVPYTAAREIDPGASAWETEPDFAIEHHLIFGERQPPIWNPYVGYGVPLAADAQSQPYSPFAWIAIAWSSARGYDLFVVLRIFAGALFAFLFLRQFIRFTPALAGAVAFMFSGYNLYFLTMPHLSVEVLLPALLYSVERILRRPGTGSAALLAAVVASVVLGGMPESAALALTFGTVYLVGRVAFDGSLRPEWRAYAPYLFLGAAVGIGLSAVLLLPLLEYVPLSWNSHTGPQGLTSDKGTLSWSTLAGYLAPLYLRPWTFVGTLRGFFGCSILFFALAGFFSGVVDVAKRRTERNTLVILILGITAFMLLAKRFGADFINWIGALPILRAIVFTKYEEAEIGCCVALLAGFGVARLCEKRVTTTSIWIAALIPLAILTAAAGETQQAFAKLSQGQEYYTLGFSAALIFLALAAAVVALYYSGRLQLSYFAGAALALVVMEPLATYVVPIYYVVNGAPPQSSSALLGAPYVDYLKSHMTDNYRLYGQDSLLYPQWSGAFGLEDVRDLDGLYPARYLSFVSLFLGDGGPGGDNLASRFIGAGDDMTTPMSQRFLALSSVRYVASTGDLTRSADFRKIDAFRKAYDVNGIRVFQFQSPLPRVAIFHRIIRADNSEDALQALRSDTFDPYTEAVAEGQPAAFTGLTGNRRSAVAAGHIEEYKATYVKAVVKTDSPGFVVLNDTNFPGWFASVDGHAAPLFDANYLFRGIVVPAGTHVIEYRYSPRSFAIGLMLSLISLFALGCMGLISWITRRTALRLN